MEHREFLLKLRQHRIVLALLSVVAFGTAAAYNYYGLEHGSATIAIKIYGTPMIYSTDNDAVYQNLFRANDTYEKQRLILYSDEMLQHLINEFNLYSYYGEDRNAPYAFVRLRRVVAERMSFDKKVMDVIVLSYRDRDGVMAMNMLNAVAEKLEQINRGEVNAALEAHTRVHERSIRGLSAAIEKTSANREDLLWRYSQLEADPHRTADEAKELVGMQLLLYEQSGRLGALAAKLQQTVYARETAVSEPERQLRPIVNIVSRPSPSSSVSTLEVMGYGVAGVCFVLLAALSLMYYGNLYAWELRTLFWK